MSSSSQKLLAKAKRAIASAARQLEDGDPDFATARAYYAMFYIAEALLAQKGLSFSSHGAVHGAFGKHFTKTGTLDKKFHKWLIDAFDKRLTTDYGEEIQVVDEDAKVVIDQASAFLQAAHTYLETSG